jgi:two-component system, response regulator PdtaR
MKKILIVEDELIIMFVMKTFLEKLGYQLADAVSEGEAAIETMKICKPDVILMDICLRGNMDGIETMEQIRKFSNVPVIYTTAIADQQTRERARQTGNSHLLIKPTSKDTLKENLEAILEIIAT